MRKANQQIFELQRITCPPIKMRILIVSLLFFFSVSTAFAVEIPKLASGQGKFDFSFAGKTIAVWYFIPKQTNSETPIVFAMHGVKRNADKYRNTWQPLAQQYGFILVCPEFSEANFPGNNGYAMGGLSYGRTVLNEASSYNFIVPIFNEIKHRTENRSSDFYIYGHSAGSQFVHRFVYFVPHAPIKMAVAANSGWWTMPNLKVDFPYGLRGSSLDEASLRIALQRPLVILLGSKDNDPNHRELRKTKEAEAQGPHRLARGHKFFEEAQISAKELNTHLAWKLGIVDGVAHQDSGMSKAAVKYFFTDKIEK